MKADKMQSFAQDMAAEQIEKAQEIRKSDKTILQVTSLKKHYRQKNKRNVLVRSLDGVNFELKKGECLGIIGESGCGKSTLGRVLIGLEEATAGEILIDWEDINDLKKKNRKELRRKAQMVFQNPFDTFDNRIRIGDILTSTLKLHDIGKTSKTRKQIVLDSLKQVGLLPEEDFFKRYPNELSGGQLQRISILRSMLLKPEFIVADEPVSMLDVSVRAEVIHMLRRMAEQENTAVVFISHDIATTRYIADRIAVMYLGKIMEMGTANEVITSPMHPYTKALISNCGDADPRHKMEPLKVKGEPPSPMNIPEGCSFSDRCPYATDRCRSEEQTLHDFKEDGHLVRCRFALQHN